MSADEMAKGLRAVRLDMNLDVHRRVWHVDIEVFGQNCGYTEAHDAVTAMIGGLRIMIEADLRAFEASEDRTRLRKRWADALYRIGLSFGAKADTT